MILAGLPRGELDAHLRFLWNGAPHIGLHPSLVDITQPLRLDPVDQLQGQIEELGEQLNWKQAQLDTTEGERQMAQARLELARRNMAEAFAAVPSPSELKQH